VQVFHDLRDERFRGKRQNSQEADSCEERKTRGELVAVLEAHRARRTCAKVKDTPAVTKLENCRRLAWRGSWTLPRAQCNLEPGYAIFKDTYCGEFLPTLAGA